MRTSVIADTYRWMSRSGRALSRWIEKATSSAVKGGAALKQHPVAQPEAPDGALAKLPRRREARCEGHLPVVADERLEDVHGDRVRHDLEFSIGVERLDV